MIKRIRINICLIDYCDACLRILNGSRIKLLGTESVKRIVNW